MNVFQEGGSKTMPTNIIQQTKENMEEKKSQKSEILKHLIKYGTLTKLEAIEKFGCLHLGARIHEFRTEGYVIENEEKSGINRYGNPYQYVVYRLDKEHGKYAWLQAVKEAERNNGR